MAFADWASDKVRVSATAVESANVIRASLEGYACLWRYVLRPQVNADAAADAMATVQWACMGGWWMDDGVEDWSRAWWWRKDVAVEDLSPWFAFRGAWSHDIVFFEALAQLVLFVLRTALLP